MKQFRGYGGVRKLCSLLMLASLLQMPVMAADVLTDVEYGETGNTITSTFTGQIPATILDIDLPVASIAFDVDPNLPLESNGYNQVEAGTGYVEFDNRGGAVKLSVLRLEDYDTTVTLGGASPEDIPFTYFETMADVTALVSKPALKGKEAGVMVSLWLTGEGLRRPGSESDLEEKALTPDSAGVVIGTIPQATRATLQVYCYAKTNFIGRSFSFTLTPVLKAELDTEG